jgi:hypothetical protein
MEAEVLRDSILHTAGELDMALGGKEIEQGLGLTTPRRSLYFEHHGEGRMPFLDLFDAANPCDCYRRSTSVRPQQALAMANGELPAAKGAALAAKLTEVLASADRVESFIFAAFEQVLARPPTAEELAAATRFLDKQQALLENVGQQSGDAARMRARASLVQALFSHQDFVTIR